MQSKFLVLLEDAIWQPDIARSVKRYQIVMNKTKIRLNLATAHGAWIMPSRMVINTKSVVGYNNKLKQAKQGMKLGVSNDVNTKTKKVGITSMDGTPSKINRPTCHPSNHIHKAAIVAQAPDSTPVPPPVQETKPGDTAREKSRTWLIAGLCLTIYAVSHAWSRAR